MVETNYRTLDEQSVIEYIQNLSIFSADAKLTCREIGDGNLNLVFQIEDQLTEKKVIVKQSLPYARVVGESMPLTVDRNRIEAEALKEEGKYCPEHTVQLFHADPDLRIFVMEDLSDHVIMRKGLIEKQEYPQFADHISTYLANTLFYTSDYYMNPLEKKSLVKRFINPELCKISEDLIFTQPYYDAPENNIPPGVRPLAEQIWKDEELKGEVAKLKHRFMTKAEALLHGDLHTGSIFVRPDRTKVIDPEFAFVGPIGFDIGAVIANLLLNYAAQEGWAENEEEKHVVRSRLLQMAADVWTLFSQKFTALYEKDCHDPMFSQPSFKEFTMKEIFSDTLGYAGCKMIRRIYGLAHVADIDTIKDDVKRLQAQRLALAIGRSLIINRHQVKQINEVKALIQSVE
ncbi:MAG: S-methyl-5-thioribose kinase [Bacillus sp. (in: Bacteria)]|nr:S-methyl-5-thioribose kinase [Bacillus sp. (in: firmicutes)]